MYRTIDANLNRVCEGLRIIEDFLRFELEPSEINKVLQDIDFLKQIRHFLRENIKASKSKLLLHRDSIADSGKNYSKIEANRNTKIDLVQANFYRIEEGLRVLEECAKINDSIKKFTGKIKQFRFKIYTVEKNILNLLNKKGIDLSRYLIMELDNIKTYDLKLISKLIIKNKITSLALSAGSFNNALSPKLSSAPDNFRDFYKKAKYFKENCPVSSLIILNSLETALISNSDGILITEDYNIGIKDLKKVYNKSIGYLADNKLYLPFLKEPGIDYILCDNNAIFTKIKKENQKKSAIQIILPSINNDQKLKIISRTFSDSDGKKKALSPK
jgi:thiamine-phosphate pyrophosphorylase